MRHEFPGLAGRTYLDWAAVGIPPLRAVNVLRLFVDSLSSDTPSAMGSDVQAKARAELRRAMGLILGCPPDRVSITGTSTTSAVQTAIDAIAPQKGESVVILDMDFPLVYQEAARLKMKGVDVRVVRNTDGDYSVDQLYDVVDRRTRALIVSSVQWVSGSRLDVREMAKVVHEVGGYIVVDAIQHAGALRVDADANGLDFVAVGTQKWLLAPFGVGVLCASRRAVEELQPPRPGYMNMPVSDWQSFWASPSKAPFSVPPFEPPSGTKFDYGGFFPAGPLLAAAASASLILEVGLEQVEASVLRLRRILWEELEDARAEVLSPPEQSKASGILLFRINDNISREMVLVERLRSKGIYVSLRGAAGVWGLRASTHFINNEEDLEALTEEVRRARERA